MTPKEKALELFKESSRLGNSYCAKRHCIFFIDEIIKSVSMCYSEDNVINYWIEVKQEINKL
jgi:hypothetical protein